MIIFIIILVIILIIFLVNYSSSQESKRQLDAKGGLRNILSNLDDVLVDADFQYYQNSGTSIEYRKNYEQHNLYIKLVVRKCYSDKDPYEMQMFLVQHGQVAKKTIPYIIRQNYSDEQFQDIIIRMTGEIAQN